MGPEKSSHFRDKDISCWKELRQNYAGWDWAIMKWTGMKFLKMQWMKNVTFYGWGQFLFNESIKQNKKPLQYKVMAEFEILLIFNSQTQMLC